MDVVEMEGDRNGGRPGRLVCGAGQGRSRPPWYLTAFSLIWRITGARAASAPSTIASACSRVMTLNAATAPRRAAASAISSPVAAMGMATPG